MHLSAISALSFLAVGSLCHNLDIPQVEAIVDKTLIRLEKYVNFEGNKSESSSISKRQAAPYWYEQIAHRGISAFGPSGYSVYRNVKDYGARGKDTFFDLNHRVPDMLTRVCHRRWGD